MANDRGEGRRKAINGGRLFGCALTLVVQFCSEAAPLSPTPLSPSVVCRDSSGSRLTRVTMPCAAELVNGEGGAIKVGTTGTIGSLVTRELDTIKVAPQVATTPRLRCQSSPVSVPCGASPRKIILRKSSSNATTSSSNDRTDRVSAEEACKPRRSSQRSTFNSPMLPSDGVLVDRSPNVDKAKKKGNVCGVEVVDVKCGNPMSSRLRKLGFSKLSETFA